METFTPTISFAELSVHLRIRVVNRRGQDHSPAAMPVGSQYRAVYQDNQMDLDLNGGRIVRQDSLAAASLNWPSHTDKFILIDALEAPYGANRQGVREKRTGQAPMVPAAYQLRRPERVSRGRA